MNNKPIYSSDYSRRISVLISVFALLSGGFIYFFFRSPDYEFVRWIRTLDFDPWFNLAKKDPFPQNLLIREWAVFSLPNGLWAFAYALLITMIWWGSKSLLKYLWLGTIPLLVLGFEALQLTGTIPGTFCSQDIAFGIAGLTSGIMTGIKITKPDYHEKTSQ
ncbi:MAG: hypothetical protein IH594_16455 [Bacteroidales bacterium]|nr:hypothetical protein [Bacteroidales bacterium]